MENTQPTTPQTQTSHPSVTPTFKSTSAEDLLNMYDSVATQEATEEVITNEPEVQSEEPASQEPPSKPEPEIKPSTEVKPEGKDSGVEPEKSDNIQEKEATGVKAFQAKFNGKNVAIPEEAAIPIKIGEKSVEVKIRDAVTAFAKQEEFNRNIQRRLTVADNREKQARKIEESFNQEKAAVTHRAEQFVKAAMGRDLFGAIRAMAVIAAGKSGVDPVQIEKQTLDSIEEVYKTYTQMTPEQRELYVAKRRAQELEKENKNVSQKLAFQKDVQDVTLEIANRCASSGIAEDDFWNCYKLIIDPNDGIVGEGKRIKSVDNVQPDDVFHFINFRNTYNRVNGVLNKINPEIAQNNDFRNWLIDQVSANPEISDADMEEIVKTAISTPSKQVENLNRKLDKVQSKGFRVQPKGNTSTEKAKTNDIDDEMYEHFFGRRKLVAR